MPGITEIRTRRGTSAQWAISNPVLGQGVMGLESDTNMIKFGDGATLWSDLPYFGGRADQTDASRVIGFSSYDPATLDSVQVTSTTATYIGGGVDGIQNYSVDFIAPATGRVRITADLYLMIQTATNEYVGLGFAIGGQVPPESSRLTLRRGPLANDINEARVQFEYGFTDLKPFAQYTVTLVGYIMGTGSYYINSGGAFGATTLTAVAEAIPLNPNGSPSVEVKAPTTVVSNGKYNSFAGLIKCPNGDLLGIYRDGDTHTTGSLGLKSIRSTDSGNTWSAPVTALTIAGKDIGTATLSKIDATTIALTTWTRTSGSTPDVNGADIYLSTNNGTSWGTAKTVTMPTGYLGKYSVTESALTLFNGYYYLAVWGEPAGSAANTYQAGILRSSNLTTWTIANDFGVGYNECGVTVIGGNLVGFARDEANMVMATCKSYDGVNWTPLRAARADGIAAPKFATVASDGLAYCPMRIGGFGGYQYLAAADADGQIFRKSNIRLALAFVYGQAVELSPGRIGVLFAAQSTTTDSRIYFATYDIAS